MTLLIPYNFYNYNFSYLKMVEIFQADKIIALPYIYTGCSKKVCQNLRRYSSHLKDEKLLYGHRCGNAYFRSYVENTVSCITYTRKDLGLIIVDDNHLIRLIYIWF